MAKRSQRSSGYVVPSRGGGGALSTRTSALRSGTSAPTLELSSVSPIAFCPTSKSDLKEESCSSSRASMLLARMPLGMPLMTRITSFLSAPSSTHSSQASAVKQSLGPQRCCKRRAASHTNHNRSRASARCLLSRRARTSSRGQRERHTRPSLRVAALSKAFHWRHAEESKQPTT